ADYERALTDRGEYDVGVGRVEERPAFARVLEQLHGIREIVRECGCTPQQQQRRQQSSSHAFHAQNLPDPTSNSLESTRSGVSSTPLSLRGKGLCGEQARALA